MKVRYIRVKGHRRRYNRERSAIRCYAKAEIHTAAIG